MKKTITILLVLLVAAFAVFAVVNETVTLTSTIKPEVAYAFELGYGDSATAATGTYLTSSSTTGSLGFSADTEDTAYFDVRQGARLNLGSGVTQGYNLTVTVTDWLLAGTGTTANQTNGITMKALSLASYTDDNHNVAITSTAGITDGKTATVKVDYSAGITDENSNLFTFQADWENDANLEAGSYSATVILSYETV